MLERTWEYTAISTESQAELFGIKLFSYPWRSVGRTVQLRHPITHENFPFLSSVYAVTVESQTHLFAVAEISSGVWALYVPVLS